MPLSPSMNVIALRQLAVFMNAGSYVMSPKSSGPALICRRSIARIVPSWTGTSYFLPVRLSTIVSVSEELIVVCVRFSFSHWVGSDPVRPVGPTRQVLQFAPLAAERPPREVDRVAPAEYARSGLVRGRHPSILIVRGRVLPRGRRPRRDGGRRARTR